MNSGVRTRKVEFLDFKRRSKKLERNFLDAIERVFYSGNYILGPEVAAFEKEFSRYCGASFGIGVGSGTEAIHIALIAAGIGKGDEVITVANAGAPTIAAIELAGARPALVDINKDSRTIDTLAIEEKINKRTKAIIPVHLYGQSADMDPILEIARKRGLFVIEDACQSHGALYKGKKTGALGDMGCFSFYPTKNVGAFGDGGMIVTSNEALARRARMIREYGQSRRYKHDMRGLNSRLDEIQAAILRVKLKELDKANSRRRLLARLYNENIENSIVIKPREMSYARHVYHLYVIACPKRNELQRYLDRRGIATLIHYPLPIYRQAAYKDLKTDLPVTEKMCSSVLSLPIYPDMDNDQVLAVTKAINAF